MRGVQSRIARGNGYAHLSSMVIHHIRPLCSHDEIELGRGYVDQMKPSIRRYIVGAPTQQVVCDDYFVTSGEVAVRDMGTDEAGTAGDQNFHGGVAYHDRPHDTAETPNTTTPNGVVSKWFTIVDWPRSLRNAGRREHGRPKVKQLERQTDTTASTLRTFLDPR